MTTVDESTALAGSYVMQALDRFAEYGERDALVFRDRRISYAGLCRDIHAMAASLRAHGVTPGSAVAVLSSTRPEIIILQFAAHLLGCRTVWVPGYAPVREQNDYLSRAGARFFIYDPGRYGELAAELLAYDSSYQVLSLGPGKVGADLLAAPPDRPLAAGSALDGATPQAPPEPDSLFYTGGTTGRPKLVQHRQSFFQALLAIGAVWLARGNPSLKHLTVTGFSHVSGHMTNLLMLFTGGTVVLQGKFDIPEFLATIERERVTSTLLTPVQLYDLLDHPALADADLSSLLLLNIGGAPVAPDRLRQAVIRLGPILRLVYGLSEAAFVTEYRGVTIDPEHPQRLASCGYTFADSRIEVRDEKDEVCAPGTVGEVWVTGSLVMAGYWGEPELTREVLVDGWLCTGDLGRLEADGYLYLVDRSKDMIVTGAGAANVFTRPVENVLTSHPAVRSAAVIGVPDSAVGEAVCAFVVSAPGARVTADELRALVTAELAVYQAPRIVRFVDSLPLTTIGKVDKKALRARHADNKHSDSEHSDNGQADSKHAESEQAGSEQAAGGAAPSGG